MASGGTQWKAELATAAQGHRRGHRRLQDHGDQGQPGQGVDRPAKDVERGRRRHHQPPDPAQLGRRPRDARPRRRSASTTAPRSTSPSSTATWPSRPTTRPCRVASPPSPTSTRSRQSTADQSALSTAASSRSGSSRRPGPAPARRAVPCDVVSDNSSCDIYAALTVASGDCRQRRERVHRLGHRRPEDARAQRRRHHRQQRHGRRRDADLQHRRSSPTRPPTRATSPLERHATACPPRSAGDRTSRRGRPRSPSTRTATTRPITKSVDRAGRDRPARLDQVRREHHHR